jgi:pheromone shutdown protein TraB
LRGSEEKVSGLFSKKSPDTFSWPMWEARNLAIAARIRAESASHPGGKVLVLIGASHRLFIEAYLATMMDVRIVPLTQNLGGAAPPKSR